MWVLDDGPLGLLARIVAPAAFARWPRDLLHVVQEVSDGAKKDRTGRRTALLDATAADGQRIISAHSILVGTPASTYLFEHLRTSSASATKDLGEHASVALCAFDLADATFVTLDKGAAYLALAELGPGRVATPYDLWMDLSRQVLVERSQFNELCELTWRGQSEVGVPRRVRP